MKNLESNHLPQLPEEESTDYGRYSEMHRVVVDIESKKGRTKKVPMIVKVPRPGFELEARGTYEDTARSYDELQESGIPKKYLVPTLRYDKRDVSSPKLYATDLTEGDKKMVFSSGSYIRSTLGSEYEGGVKIKIKNPYEVLLSLVDIARACTDKGFKLLREDAFYFIFDKDNHDCKVILGDYKWVFNEIDYDKDKGKNNLDMIPSQKEDLQNHNLILAINTARSVCEFLSLSNEEIRIFFEKEGLKVD